MIMKIQISRLVYALAEPTFVTTCCIVLRSQVDWGMAPVTSLLTAQTCLPLLKLGLQLRWNDSKCCRWSIAFLQLGSTIRLGLYQD